MGVTNFLEGKVLDLEALINCANLRLIYLAEVWQ